MKLTVTEQAAERYKDEMDLEEGDAIRFYVKLYGESKVHPNFSLGVSKEKAVDLSTHYNTTVSGICFFFDDQDVWYLQDHELTVDLEQDEIAFLMKTNA